MPPTPTQKDFYSNSTKYYYLIKPHIHKITAYSITRIYSQVQQSVTLITQITLINCLYSVYKEVYREFQYRKVSSQYTKEIPVFDYWNPSTFEVSTFHFTLFVQTGHLLCANPAIKTAYRNIHQNHCNINRPIFTEGLTQKAYTIHQRVVL